MMALTKIYISPTDELEKSTLCFFDVAIEEKMIQKNVVFFSFTVSSKLCTCLILNIHDV